MSFPFLIQGSNIVVVIGNKSHTVSKTHITYNILLAAIKAQDWQAVEDAIEPKKVIINYGAGDVSIKGDTLFWKDKELHNSLSDRMISMLQEGFSIEPMALFMENLMKNPSHRAVTELYAFLEKNNLPITPDGYFLAYKKVRNNFFDMHSGTMDNSIGNMVEMPRNEVNDNKDETCSTGLHFCSQDYLKSFYGDRIVIVKINPRDVVSIPTDYNDSKGRACRYEVIGELNVNPEDAFTRVVQATATGSQPVDTIVPPIYKTGSTEFIQGYTCGYTNNEFGYDLINTVGKNYSEGYAKGLSDFNLGKTKRFQYVEPSNFPY